jgi:hypothetical protein
LRYQINITSKGGTIFGLLLVYYWLVSMTPAKHDLTKVNHTGNAFIALSLIPVKCIEMPNLSDTIGGHPQFKSAPLQLRNISDNQIDCGVAD